jgi:hypothetical protein
MGGGTSSESSNEVTIPAWIKGPLLEMFQSANNASRQISDQPFQGDFIAGTNNTEQEGLNALRKAFQGFDPAAGQAVSELGLKTARGDFADPTKNAALQNILQQVQTSGNRNLQENVLPQIGGRRADSAQHARVALREGQAIGDTQEAITNAQSGLLFNNQQAERDRQNAAPGLITAGRGLSTAGGAGLAQVGGAQRDLSQLGLNNDIARFQEEQAAPLRRAQAMMPFIQGILPSVTGQKGKSRQSGNLGADITKGVLGGGALVANVLGG